MLGARRQLELGDQLAVLLKAPSVAFQRHDQGGIDHRPDVGGQFAWVPQAQFTQRASQHDQHLVRDVRLNEKQAQRRTALTGRVEGRPQHVRAQLLG